MGYPLTSTIFKIKYIMGLTLGSKTTSFPYTATNIFIISHTFIALCSVEILIHPL